MGCMEECIARGAPQQAALLLLYARQLQLFHRQQRLCGQLTALFAPFAVQMVLPCTSLRVIRKSWACVPTSQAADYLLILPDTQTPGHQHTHYQHILTTSRVTLEGVPFTCLPNNHASQTSIQANSRDEKAESRLACC